MFPQQHSTTALCEAPNACIPTCVNAGFLSAWNATYKCIHTVILRPRALVIYCNLFVRDNAMALQTKGSVIFLHSQPGVLGLFSLVGLGIGAHQGMGGMEMGYDIRADRILTEQQKKAKFWFKHNCKSSLITQHCISQHNGEGQ